MHPIIGCVDKSAAGGHRGRIRVALRAPETSGEAGSACRIERDPTAEDEEPAGECQ
jgi:hypothetical protein